MKVYANEQRKITCGEFAENFFVSLVDSVNLCIPVMI